MSRAQKIILKAVITGVFAVLLGFFITSEVRADEAVPYIIRSWDDSNKKLTVSTGSCNDYNTIEANDFDWDQSNFGNWYVVKDNVEINNRITVHGTVNLILCDGATLTAKGGIEVKQGDGLNIYAQSAGTGTLLAGTVVIIGDNKAGIGSNYELGGTIKIYGGNVTAVGGDYGAGIGGGQNGNGGTIEIYDGNVTATGGSAAAGIGGGQNGNGGTIEIYGGTVNATGGYDNTQDFGGAGIGGGSYGSGGTVTINGGIINAQSEMLGSGIGGGSYGSSGTVTINGGTVTANGGDYGAGIGGGHYRDGANIAINGGIVYATGGDNAKGIGRGGFGSSDGSLTLGSGVELYTSDDNSGWGDPADVGPKTTTADRKKYMKTITPIPYMNWDGTNNKLVAASTGTTDYTTVAGQLTWGTAGTTTWYVLRNDVQIDSRITVAGTVNLILCDGKTLTATKGITVQDDDNNLETTSPNTLNIYGQSEGTGILYAGTSNGTIVTLENKNAGIGGGENGNGGTIDIYGGTVTATGGTKAAGIGGGYYGKGGSIDIYGGIVNAIGGDGGAGIGGGNFGEGEGGSITINGGTVNATGGQYGAGIGGGMQETGVSVTINGGTVYAYGGETGAGIGGGRLGDGGTITINGGTVNATGGNKGAGIGGGLNGASGNITINGGFVIATGGVEAKGIGKGYGNPLDGSLTLDPDVKLLTSTDNSEWTDTTNTPSTRTQYMKAFIPISYMTWDPTEQKLVAASTGSTAFTILTDQTDWNNNSPNTGWYVVKDNITINDRITVNGTVNLILCDGKTLTAPKGITVQDNDNNPDTESTNILNIYGQSSGTGKLLAGTSDGTSVTTDRENAGIGGEYNIAGGTITINGGTVTAYGGLQGAGIGAGSFCDSERAGGTITVNGGTVTAKGGEEGTAGIGGGLYGMGGNVTINGGTVTAIGGEDGAGIGGGEERAGGNVTINGGTVIATGGRNAAGIGGGHEGAGGNVTINGGTVTATSESHGAGIGGGYNNGSTIVHGTLTLGSGVYVFAKADGTPATTGDPLTIDTDRKVTGDRQQYMKSVLQYVVTFKVVNGSWNDGTNADKIVRLTRGENEDLLLKLSDSDIPTVGSKPAGGYTAGSWDVTPPTDIVISEDKTYTYTYSQSSHKHSFTSHVTKPATCTETGVMTYTCSCGASYTSVIPVNPDNHNYDEGKVTRPATVVSDGLKTFTCTRCGATKTEVIPKLDPATEEEKDITEQIEALIEDLKDENGELKVEVDIITEKKEDGTTETVVTVGGEEVVKIITDEDGEEKIESNIWSIGGDGVYTYTGLAIKPDVQVYDGLKKLSAGSDYSVSYKNNTNAGTKAEAKVSFKGGYKGTPAIKANFTIDPADLSKDATATGMIIAANGKDQKPIPEITLISSGKNLGKGDLKYRYLNSKGEVVSGIKEVGDYTVEAKGKKDNGNFTGVASTTITVTGDKTKLLSNGKVKLTKKSFTYTGKPIIPVKGTYTLTLNGTELKEGEDYTLKVKNNVDPGKATMIFTAADENKGGYVGKISAKFTISKGKELKAAGEGSDFTYIYEENVPFSKGGPKPELIVMDDDTVLTPGKDYTVNYSNNTKVTDGKDAVMTVKGKGIYKGSVTLPYGITKQDIATLSGNIIVSDKAVSKKGYKNPAVTITDLDGKKLAKDKDYALSDDYTTPDENGVVTVTLIGKGNYSGTVPVSYRYLNKNVMLDNVKASKITDKVYTGSRIKLTKKELAKLLYTGNVKSPTYLVEGKDFEVVGYSNNLKTGTAKVTLRGLGDRGGTKTVSFKIVASKKSIINVIVGALKK